MTTTLERTLETIGKKIQAGERLDADDGLTLLTHPDTKTVSALANAKRKQQIGDAVSFASTFYIHPTNLCELSCPMCSFYAKPGWDTAWFLTPEAIEKKIREALPRGLNEIHIVGGLWRDCTLDYYKEVFARIHNIDPNLHIKALTPVEYDFLAKLHNLSIEEVFQAFLAMGLGSLPGGGAEILVEEIRKQVAPQKITSDEYLEIHQTAHRAGIPSNVTMLFGHVEEPHHIITHLVKVRQTQDQTGGFKAFVPLKYHTENNALGKRKKRLKNPPKMANLYATCRLMLDNIPHIKVLWNYVGLETALELLDCGCDDLSSTNEEERIITMAGGIGQRVKMTAETLSALICQIGRTPRLCHSGYET